MTLWAKPPRESVRAACNCWRLFHWYWRSRGPCRMKPTHNGFTLVTTGRHLYQFVESFSRDALPSSPVTTVRLSASHERANRSTNIYVIHTLYLVNPNLPLWVATKPHQTGFEFLVGTDGCILGCRWFCAVNVCSLGACPKIACFI